MKVSAVSWTDYSSGDLNFVSGCTPVSESCQNCYARAIYERFGRDFSKVVVDSAKLWRAFSSKAYGDFSPKRGPGYKPMCFLCDTGDIAHEAVPDSFLLDAWRLMAARKDVIWQVLTKRPHRLLDFLSNYGYQYQIGGEPNIHIGVTAENRARANERIPILLEIPAAVRFVSAEPMLGPVDLRQYLPMRHADGTLYFSYRYGHKHGLSWVIAGAESGPNRRPFDVAWAEALYQQCKEAGTPYFGKQDSGLYPGVPLILSDGIVHQWPEA